MAKTIQPVSSWQNGEEKQATQFVLNSSFDNLSTTANFQYQLNEIISDNPNLMYSTNTLVSGSLTMSGSATFIQVTGSLPAIASSGSLYIIDSINSITGSLEGNPVDGGSF